MDILPFTPEYIDSIKSFSDQVIGSNYFSRDQLVEIEKNTQSQGQRASYVLVDDKNEVKGFRLSYPPKKWLGLKKPGQVHPELWNVDPDQVAYFQSIFLADDIRGCGWGYKLSQASINSLQEMGAKAIVCHSWKESPRNSSMRYLEKAGFKVIKEIPNYWLDVDYECVRCGRPCLCTATEMVFYL